MNVQTMTPNQVRKAGLDALAKTLKPLGMVRFLQQFEIGSGDYTQERAKYWKQLNVKSIVKEIKSQRK